MAEPKMAESKSELDPMNTKTDVREQRPAAGLEFQRMFTDGKVSPFDKVEWDRRTALIGNEKGQTIFRQENVEVPKSWSQTSTNIVASKYFHGKPNTAERETSVRQLIGRVVDTIVNWGEKTTDEMCFILGFYYRDDGDTTPVSPVDACVPAKSGLLCFGAPAVAGG